MPDASAPSSANLSVRRWSADVWVSWLLLTLYFLTPPREVFSPALDPSNYASYAYFLAHGFQWGAQVIPMAGPLGFVHYGYCYSGELFGLRVIADLFLCAGFSALMLHFFVQAPRGGLRWIWLATMVLVVPMIDDLLLDSTVVLAALALLLGPSGKLDRWSALGCVLMAFIALIKGTHLMMCGLVFGSALLLGVVERRPGRVWRPLTLFVGALLCFWIIAGQKLWNFPAHIAGVRALASGYNETMGLEAVPFLLGLGLIVLTALALVLLCAAAHARRSVGAAVVLLFLTAFAFLKWKHGFVRPDGHVFIFFGGAAVIAIIAWFVAFTQVPESAPATAGAQAGRLLRLGLVTAVVVTGILGAGEFWVLRVPFMLRDLPGRFQSHAGYLLQPGATRAKLERELEAMRVAKDLPQVRAEVKGDAIDFFGYEEGVVLLNRMNYRPRPMGGGTFSVLNEWLLRRNEAHLLHPATAPAWELFKLASIDDRLPAGDDGLTLRAIIDCYSPVLMQRDYLLLKRTGNRTPASAPRLLRTVAAVPGQPIEVPDPGPGQMVLFTVAAPTNLQGRLRTFLYHAPVLSGRFFTTLYPRGKNFVLKPALLHDPVLLSPLLEDTLDFIQLFGDAPGNVVRSLALDAAPGFAIERLSVSFFSAPRPAKPADTDLNELLTYARHPLHNREPVNMVTGNTGIKELDKDPITLIHAPGSITWDLRPGDQQVLFSYGLMPQAYLNGGTTNGVEFNVEVLWPPADGRVLFKHMLLPRTVTSDQGMHRTRVFLPPYEPGAQLRIRTDPGPDGDGAYDQSYVTRVQIKSGPLVPDQFNGLGLIPTDRRLPHEAVAGIGTQPVYLVHAPSELTLDIPEGAKEFHAQIGLLPGAYANEGKTDGVGFTFWLERSGTDRRQIWSRVLNPLHQPADRGSVSIVVPLPEPVPGSRLVLTTDVGPNGDRGWDQSFIEQARFE